MAHQPSLRPDPLLRSEPVDDPLPFRKPPSVWEKDDGTGHLAELTATLASHGGGESSSDLALDLVLNEIVEQARLSTSASGAAIALDRGHEMVCRATAGDSAPDLGVRLNTESGLSGECVRTHQVQCCDDSELDVRVDAAACRTLGVRSIIMLPVLDREELIGLFEALSPRPNAFGPREIQGLQALTRRIVDNVIYSPASEAVSEPAKTASENTEFPVLNFPAEPPARGWFKRDALTGILTGLVIVLAGVLGWMVGRAGWDMAVTRVPDAQTTATATTLETAAPQKLEEAVPPPRAGKAETRKKAAPVVAPPVVTPEPATAAADLVTPGAGTTAQNADTAATQAAPPAPPAPPPVAKADNAAPAKSALPEPPVGGLVVYDKGKVVFQMKEHSAPAKAQPETTGQGLPGTDNNFVLHRVEPQYPEQAKLNGVQGPVVLSVLVDTDGMVEQVHVVSGEPQLAGAAEDAVRQWRFQPYLSHGQAAEFETRVTVNFALP